MITLKRAALTPQFIAFLVASCAFLVYWKTLAPTVDFIDSGELATVASTLGIAHPTGYPLFTLLGWLFSQLPFASEQIVRLNVMAAFFCAAGVFVFFRVVFFVLVLLPERGRAPRFASEEKHSLALLAASAAASLLWGFSETYWSQAVAVEVYSLHVFLLSLVTFTFLKANFPEGAPQNQYEKHSGGYRDRWWYAFAFTLGLSFTNHMTTILLAPGSLYLYFALHGTGVESWKRIGRMVLPFLFGLSVYLYLPLRASQSPALNWGNTVTLEKFLWHVTGKQYRVWIFSSTESAARQFKYFLDSLPSEFAYIGLPVALAGVIVLWRTQKKLLVATLLFFGSCVFYSINYDIHDIDSYFLLAYFCVALWGGCGMLMVASWLLARTKAHPRLIAGMVVATALIPLFYHYGMRDESKNYLVEDYTKNMFASFQPNALVLSYQWDYWVSAAYYYQIVGGLRPDVVVVDKELLRRSWYIKQLQNRYPWLIGDSKPEVDAFLEELSKFEHERQYSPAMIQARYVGMILSFIRRSMASRPVYVTGEIEMEFTPGYQRVPEGLAYRLHADTAFHPTIIPPLAYRRSERRGRLEDVVRSFYYEAFLARGEYYSKQGNHPVEASEAFGMAQFYNPRRGQNPP